METKLINGLAKQITDRYSRNDVMAYCTDICVGWETWRAEDCFELEVVTDDWLVQMLITPEYTTRRYGRLDCAEEDIDIIIDEITGIERCKVTLIENDDDETFTEREKRQLEEELMTLWS